MFYLRDNKLSLNYNKTNFILLNSQKRNPTSSKVTTNNNSISPRDNLKYLGVLLVNKLRWREVGDSSQSFSSDTLQGISSE